MAGAHLVVREDQVGAAALDVEGDAEVLQRDGGALDVPARAARAERAAVPRRLALALGPPQQRVERVALARPVGVAAALGEDLQHLARGSSSRHRAEPRVARRRRSRVVAALGPS